MNLRNFHGIDLNLLVAFEALMAERSVVRAAERVFLGQPAMSHALGRLRETLGDPLFVRTGNRMEPTAFAMALAPKVHAWLAEADAFLFDPAAFDPAHVTTTIQIGIPDGVEALLFPPMVAALRREAPGVTLRATPLAADRVLRALDADEIDLAVSPSTEGLREWHGQLPLFTSGFDCLYSRRHITMPKRVSLRSLAKLDHVAYSYRGDNTGLIDAFFEAQGLERRVTVVSASLIAIGRIVAASPVVSIQPSVYAPLYHDLIGSESQLAVLPLDEAHMKLEFKLSWHRRNEQNAVHAFVRDMARRLLTGA